MKIILPLILLVVFTNSTLASESFMFNSEKQNEVVITSTCSIKLNKVEQKSFKNSGAIEQSSYKIFYDGNRSANVKLTKTSLNTINKDNYYDSLKDGDMRFFNKSTKNNVDIFELKTKKGNAGYQIVASTPHGLNIIMTKNSFFYNTIRSSCFSARR